MQLPQEKLDLILRRHDEINGRLAANPEAATFVALSRELAGLEDVTTAIRAYRSQAKELDGIALMLGDASLDTEMRGLAEAEREDGQARLDALSRTLQIALLPKDAADEKSAILEIRAGTGGDEAALFAGDLFRMYQRYAETKGWAVEIVSASEGTAGGFKEIIAEVERRRGVRQAEVRIGRPSRPAGARIPKRRGASTPRPRPWRCCRRRRRSTSTLTTPT